jgi:hypothetical protein
MPKLTPEQRQHLINQYTNEIDALNDSLPESMTFYDLEKTIEQTGKRILSNTLETLANQPTARISPPMPSLSKTRPKKRD